MSLISVACLAAFLVPGVVADGGEKPHGPDVAEAWHEPDSPRRGESVRVRLVLNESATVKNIVLTYCRAERYACAPSVAMESNPTDGSYQATIPWHPGFFEGVEHVGYNFTLKHGDGNATFSPKDYWPFRPDSLPPEAGIYYFYKLEGKIPHTPVPSLLAALAGLVVVLRRRRT